MYRGNNNGSEVMKATKCQKDEEDLPT